MSNRTGLSLVEILVAMVVFGSAAVGIAKLVTTGSSRGRVAAGSSQQTTMLISEYSRAVAVPAAASAAGLTCDTVPLAPWRFERCTRVTNVSSREQRLAIVVTPVGTAARVSGVGGAAMSHAAVSTNAPFRADSMTIVRAANVGALSLNSP